MAINLDKNAIFIHIPKTGGTSIYQKFQGGRYIDKHASLSDALTNMDDLDDWFTFSFVRNPWDRLYSNYSFLCQRRVSSYEKPIPQEYYTTIGFKKWVLEKLTWVEPCCSASNHPMQTQQQFDWLVDHDNKIAVDFIGRYENLQSDWDKVCDIINLRKIELPMINKTTRFINYRDAYDDDTYEFVCKHFKQDIDEFGYKF